MGDEWPGFWFEPWRWADSGWFPRYGAPFVPVGLDATRLAFGGWIGAFGLEREWRLPADRRWLQLLGVAPATLRELAAVLGWIAMLRAPGGLALAHARGADRDQLWRCAFRYRDVNWIEARIGESRDIAYDAHAHGLRFLRLAADTQWPDIARRLAMMLAPGAAHAEGPLTDTRIDAGRCLTLALAVARRLGTTAAATVGRIGEKAAT
jgi:hypothetical protein